MKKKKLKAKLSKTRSKLSKMVKELAEAESVIEALSLNKVGNSAESNGSSKIDLRTSKASDQKPVYSGTAKKKP